MTLVVSPRVSEKSFGSASEKNGVYTFVVPQDQNKHQIKQTVEKLYEVTVLNVNVSILKGKNKRFTMRRGKQSLGKRQDVKKAYVRLKEGDSIPVFNPEADKDSTPKVVKKGKK